MKIDQPANRQSWSRQQQVLRRWLMKDQDYAKALPLFLSQHAMMHAARLRAGVGWSFQDEVVSGLSDAQMRHIPEGWPHSAAWSLWHITRIEDITLNLLLADAPQLLHSGNWLDKLGVAYEGVGNELSARAIAEISQAINLKALFAYRLAVGRRTRAVARRLDPDRLWARPERVRLNRLSAEGAVSAKASWLLAYWGGHPAANLLLMPATRHGFIHLNEIQRMTPKLKQLSSN